MYVQHAHPVTVARISPSGFYAASADTSGSVRIWDLAGGEQMLKTQVQALSGRVNDLVWDGESKRIIAVGEGRESYGRAFFFDSGSSVGEISGHSKPINAVAVRQQRPFKAVTASDDASVVFLNGVPYKYGKTITSHSRFVQDVAYAPSGAVFASAGSDGKLVLYDGTTGDVRGECLDGSQAHQGTVFALSFAPDSKHLVSCGADGQVKVWDAESRALVTSWDASGTETDKVAAQQVGVVWTAAQRIASVSLSGRLNVFAVDTAAPKLEAPTPLFGAGKGIASLVAADQQLVAGSYDGNLYEYPADGKAQVVVSPVAAKPGIVALGRGPGSALLLVSLDNALRRVEGGNYAPQSAATNGHVRSLFVAQSGEAFVATEQGLDMFADAAAAPKHLDVPALGGGEWTPTAVSATADGKLVALGGDDNRVRLYEHDASSQSLKLSGQLENGRSPITALAFSPDGALLAAGESTGKIFVYDVAQRQLKLHQWVFHLARINTIQWSPDGTHAVSSSLDTHVYVWSVERPMKNVSFKNAHAGGVTGAVWADAQTIATAGADGLVRKFAFVPAQ